LDATAALLGICRERTYDGEPSMILEAYAARGTSQPMRVRIVPGNDGTNILMTSDILREGREMIGRGISVSDVAATIQTSLAKGIAELAIRSTEQSGTSVAALSGGVAINRSIRETIFAELSAAGVNYVTNPRYPFGDGCISYGQVITAGVLAKGGKL
jgi:hydrogenase maturation protein HypF